jgi:hypothetical protein
MGYVPYIQIYPLPLLILHLALIKESCLWFFEMRDLIGKHPNVVPSGLGNGTSDMSMTSFFNGPDRLDDDGIGSPTRWGIADEDSVDSDEGDRSDDGRQTKGKDGAGASSKEAKLGRTGARPGSSRPATWPTKENKKKRKVDVFADVAEAEEVTRQKELDLAKAKVDTQQAKMATKQAEIVYKTQKMADRMERWREKNRERAAKLHLLQLCEQRGMGSTNHPTGGMHAAVSGSGSLLGISSLAPSAHL